ncbi:SLC13 family permease [Streptomyces sp. NPDC093085]|uniref:SLC13 family permease n=1 Tax=Streptomyces sp. NPDC093085 TaxID=3155068 RepID=UPI00343102BF
MTPLQTTSLIVLACIVALSIWKKTNIGLLGYAGAFGIALLADIDPNEALGAFPAKLVVLIIGVALLFAHAERSGAISWLVELALRPIGHRRWVIPWVAFAASAALSSIGALPAAPISLLVPIMARLARTYRLNYLVLASIVVWAANAGGLSPLSPAGALVQTIAQKADVSYSPWLLYGIMLVLFAVATAVLIGAEKWIRFVGRGRSLDAAEETPPPSEPVTNSGDGRPGGYALASLGSLLALIVGAIAFQLDVGLSALTLAMVLQLVFQPPEKDIVAKVPWPVILLLSGLIVYLHLLETIGTMKSIEDALGHIDSTVLLLVVLCYVTAIVSNMESSALVVLGVMVPIGLQGAQHSPGEALAVIIAVVMCTMVVAISPVHIGGALIIGNTRTEEQQHAVRWLFVMAGIASALVPALVVLFPVIVGT